MGTVKDAENEYLKAQVELLKAKCNDRIEVTFELGKKIGKLEHQRNEARRKHGVLKRQVRQIRFVQRAAIEENAKLVCERAILHKELRELKDRVHAFEAAQAARVEKAAAAAFDKAAAASDNARRVTALADKLEAERVG